MRQTTVETKETVKIGNDGKQLKSITMQVFQNQNQWQVNNKKQKWFNSNRQKVHDDGNLQITAMYRPDNRMR
jgi:molecular chaperone DnaK (HSP70)